MSLSHLIHSAAERHPDLPAIVGEQSSVSYAQMSERVDAAAAFLRTHQVQAGDVVALGLPQSPFWQWVFLLGALRLGAVPAVLGARPHLQLQAIVGAPPFLVVAEGSPLAHLPGVRAIEVSPDGLQKIENTRIVMGLPDAEAADATAGLILFAGLDTPRALRLDFSTVKARCADMAALVGLSYDSRLLCAAGIGSAQRVEYALATLSVGASLILPAAPDGLGAQLVVDAVNRLLVSPRALVALIRSGGLPELAGLGCQVTVVGAPLPASLSEKVRSVFGTPPQLVLGGPESGVYSCGGYEDFAAHRDCVGRARDGVLQEVVNREGQTLPDGQAGLIRVRTPFAASGYLDGGESNSGLGLRQGWYDTGLLGHVAPDGRLCVSAAAVQPSEPAAVPASVSGSSRTDHPRVWNRVELEHALTALPGIMEVCVLSQPMPDRSTVPVIVYIGDTDDTPEYLGHKVRALLGEGNRFHLIRVPSLPRLDDGSVARNRLAASLQARIRQVRAADAAARASH